MKHRAEWKVVLPAGRFAGEAHQQFFSKLGHVYRESREYTASETAAIQIQDSLENDLKIDARPHAHGNDIRTIARKRKAVVESNIGAEVTEAEATCVLAEIEVLESLLRNRQARLAEIQGGRGFVDSRTIELAAARERIARREATIQIGFSTRA